MYNGQERNIYIESKERQTMTHRVREVRDRASPNRSRETDEMSGIDLTQEQRRLNGVGLGMSVDVKNRLDARKRKGRRCIRSGMRVGVRNRLDARKRKGRRCVGSGMRQLDARESECSGVH